MSRAGATDLAVVQRVRHFSDVDLGVTLLRGVPTNEGRSEATLRQVSQRAQAFGQRMAAEQSRSPSAADREMTVVERTGGLEGTDPVVARFLHRTRTVELYTDTIAFCEELLERLNWRSLFPEGSVRSAALEHERAHDLIAHHHARDLRVAVGELAFSLGRWHRYAHIAGAEEVAAHAFAQQTLGLSRSPLLITAAAMAALDAAHKLPKES